MLSARTVCMRARVRVCVCSCVRECHSPEDSGNSSTDAEGSTVSEESPPKSKEKSGIFSEMLMSGSTVATGFTSWVMLPSRSDVSRSDASKSDAGKMRSRCELSVVFLFWLGSNRSFGSNLRGPEATNNASDVWKTSVPGVVG